MFLDEVSADNQDFLITSQRDDAANKDTGTLFLQKKQTIISFLEAHGVTHKLAKTIWKNPKLQQRNLSSVSTEDPIICSDPSESWKYCHILIPNDQVITLAKSGDEVVISKKAADPQKSLDFGRINIKNSIYQDGGLFNILL